MEQYRELDALGFPGYRVGSEGTVWQLVDGTWVELPQRRTRHRQSKRYPYVQLTRADGRRVTKWVCRLMLEAFVGQPPPGHECRHYPDPEVTNNSIHNLRWGTHSQNCLDYREQKNQRALTDEEARALGRFIVSVGSLNRARKLTLENVSTIRAAYTAGGATQRELADRYA